MEPLRRWSDLADPRSEILSRHLWHHRVGQHEVQVVFGNQSQRLVPVGCLQDRVPMLAQHPGSDLHHRWVVLDHQDRSRRFADRPRRCGPLGRDLDLQYWEIGADRGPFAQL